MNAIKILFFIFILMIQGCSSVKPVEVRKVSEAKTQLNLTPPAPIELKDLNWIVITPENAEEVFAKLQSKKYDLVLFGLTDGGYEALSLNFAIIKKYLVEQKTIIKKYQEYYEP